MKSSMTKTSQKSLVCSVVRDSPEKSLPAAGKLGKGYLPLKIKL